MGKGFRPFIVLIDLDEVLDSLDESEEPIKVDMMSPTPLLLKATSPDNAAASAADYYSEYFHDQCRERKFLVLDLENKAINNYNVVQQGFTIDEIE